MAVAFHADAQAFYGDAYALAMSQWVAPPPGLEAPLPTDAASAWSASTVPAVPAPHEAQRPRRVRANGRATQRPAQTTGLLSRGSKNHGTGQCRPCRASATAEGCLGGWACNYCHHPHEESKLLVAALFSVKKDLQRVAKIAQEGASRSKALESEHSTSAGSTSVITVSPASPRSPSPCSASMGEPKYVVLPSMAL